MNRSYALKAYYGRSGSRIVVLRGRLDALVALTQAKSHLNASSRTCTRECCGASLVDFQTRLLDGFGHVQAFLSRHSREISCTVVEYVTDSELRN